MKLVSSNNLIKLKEGIKSKFATKEEFNDKVVVIEDSIEELEKNVLNFDVVYESIEGWFLNDFNI